MLRNILTATAAVLLLSFSAVGFARADTGVGCETIEKVKAEYPDSKYTLLNKEQVDTILTKYPPPEGVDVTTVYQTVTVDNPDTLVFIIFGKDGCYQTAAQMNKENFVKVFGNNGA